MGGPAPELRAGPLVFVDDLDAPELSPDDLAHLRRSLRRGDGDPLCLADGVGAWRTAVLGGTGVDRLGPVHIEDSPRPPLTVGLAIPKGSRLDVAVAKLTEIGVDEVLLLGAERSVVRWADSEVRRRIERLERVARESAMQCRRPRLPSIRGVVDVAGAVASSPGEVALAEPGGAPPTLATPVVLVGPEGGWAPAELAVDAPSVAFGPTVLRVETAAIAAGVALCGLRGGWLRSVTNHHGGSFH